MKLNPCLCSARGLLHAFHSTKDSSWNRQSIKGKAVTTPANLQEYIKSEFIWRANGAPTEEEFQQFNRLISQVHSIGKSWILGRVRGTLCSKACSHQGLSSQHRPAHVGHQLTGSWEARKSLSYTSLKNRLLQYWRLQENLTFTLKRSICLKSLQRNLEK